jgi:fructose/tagatose bisphosphate aldolase
MADHIEDAIHRIKNVIKNGKLKHKKVKLKTDVAQKVEKEVARIMNDNIPTIDRNKICRDARKEAHKPVADAKKELSDSIRKDLGLD